MYCILQLVMANICFVKASLVTPEVLFECLVGVLGLAITLRVVTGGEVEAHVKSLPQGTRRSGT